MEIPGVPDTIPRSKVAALVEAFGLPLQDLLSFEITPEAVEAVVCARDAHGRLFEVDGEVATHLIVIRLADDDGD